jgi:hypothetical protein
MPQQEMPQCLEEGPTQPCEGKEQWEKRQKINILKNWEIRIQFHDTGCVVHVGCKSFAFESIEAAHKEIGRYIENPQLVATQHGFGDHF